MVTFTSEVSALALMVNTWPLVLKTRSFAFVQPFLLALTILLTHESRFGRLPLVRSVIPLLVTSKIFTLWIILLTVVTSHLDLAIAPFVFGIFLTTSVFFA